MDERGVMVDWPEWKLVVEGSKLSSIPLIIDSSEPMRGDPVVAGGTSVNVSIFVGNLGGFMSEMVFDGNEPPVSPALEDEGEFVSSLLTFNVGSLRDIVLGFTFIISCYDIGHKESVTTRHSH